MDFKGRAQSWDSDARIRRSKIIADKINEMVGNSKDSSVLDYGCATGLIGFNLCDKFRKVTLMDSEKEMLDVIHEKIETNKISNVFTVLKDLTKEDCEEKFDVIYTSMALHHIIDTQKMIKKF